PSTPNNERVVHRVLMGVQSFPRQPTGDAQRPFHERRASAIRSFATSAFGSARTCGLRKRIPLDGSSAPYSLRILGQCDDDVLAWPIPIRAETSWSPRLQFYSSDLVAVPR